MVSLISSKKRTKTSRHSSKKTLFVHLLEEFEDTKNHFKINWLLVWAGLGWFEMVVVHLWMSLMTSQLHHFWWGFFAAGSWEKDTENSAAVTSLKTLVRNDNFDRNRSLQDFYTMALDAPSIALAKTTAPQQPNSLCFRYTISEH